MFNKLICKFKEHEWSSNTREGVKPKKYMTVQETLDFHELYCSRCRITEKQALKKGVKPSTIYIKGGEYV